MWYALVIIDCDDVQCVEFSKVCNHIDEAIFECQQFVIGVKDYDNLNDRQTTMLYEKHTTEVETGVMCYIGMFD